MEDYRGFVHVFTVQFIIYQEEKEAILFDFIQNMKPDEKVNVKKNAPFGMNSISEENICNQICTVVIIKNHKLLSLFLTFH